jgi:hypothetical protein
MMNLIGLSEMPASAALIFGASGELVVDDHDPVFAGRDADVPAGAGEHVDRSGDFRRLHFDFAVIGLLGEGGAGGEREKDGDQFSHER